MRAFALCSTLTLALVAGIQACSTATGGTGPVEDAGTDGTTGGDAHVDAVADSEAEAEAEAEAGPEAGIDAGPDAEAGADAPPDVYDAGMVTPPCNGVRCNGVCVAASDCRSCNGAPLLCAPRGECVASCAGCSDTADAALPIQCYACDPSHRNPVGSCQRDDASTYCLSGDYSSAYVDGGAGAQCDCSDGGTSACPGGNQVCAVLGLSYLCFECGQATAAPIDGRFCQDGLRCNAASSACQ